MEDLFMRWVLLTGLFGLLIASAACAVDHAAMPEAITSLQAPQFEIPDTRGIRMIRIEKGTLQMGSPAGEVGRQGDEAQHADQPPVLHG
jgi:formylglycine-generating enzyme required for sulfatase activity